MSVERQKIRAAEWLYRWSLSNSIIGIVFTILSFMGVFTLVLGRLFVSGDGDSVVPLRPRRHRGLRTLPRQSRALLVRAGHGGHRSQPLPRPTTLSEGAPLADLHPSPAPQERPRDG